MGRVRFSGSYSSVEEEGGYSRYKVLKGEQVSLYAVANTGYQFTQWSDGESSNPYSFIAENDRTLSAAFEVQPLTPIETEFVTLNASSVNLDESLSGSLNLDPSIN